MLDFMRKNAGTWMIKFILGVIIVVFVFTFWGADLQQSGANQVAVVNGDPITAEAYRSSYNGILNQMRQQFGNNLNEDLLKMLNVEQQALNRLIDQKLLLDEAERIGLRVSDEELAVAIRAVPAFQANGTFDAQRYQRVLDNNRMTPESFEFEQRSSMILSKLRRFASEGVQVSDLEAKKWHEWQNTEVDVEYARFAPADQSEVRVNEEEISAYYDANKDRYNTPAKVDAQYLKFAFTDYTGDVRISDEDIAGYYASNRSEFVTPKTVQARHILLRIPAGDAEAEETVRRKAANLADQARDGADFAELARRHSEGPTRDRGGDLGTFRREDMVKPFADQAFAMAPGDISDPVKTSFGWHVINVEAVNPAATATVEDARPKIIAALRETGARQIARDRADQAWEATYEDDELGQVAESLGLELHRLPPFDRQGPAKEIADARGFATAAFALSEQEISDVVETADAYYVIQVVRRIPETATPFAEAKENVRSDVLAEKQKAAALAAARQVLETVTGGTSLKDAAAGTGATVALTGRFKRNAQIPGIGYEPALREAAFGLRIQQPLYDDVIEDANGVYIIRLAGRYLPDAAAYAKERDTVRQSLAQQKQTRVFRELLTRLKDDAEITVSERFRTEDESGENTSG